MRRPLLAAALLAVCLLPVELATLEAGPGGGHARPAHHLRNGFRNLDDRYSYPLFGRVLGLARRAFEPVPARGRPLEVLANDGAGLRFEDLPRIHAVVISHDHYDHLDLPTVRRLVRAHRPVFFVPLGVKAWLAERGVTDVVELDWWESRVHRGLEFTATPAQHSSGRWLHDQNDRLWASWVIRGRAQRFFFAGDTGYTPRLQEIGERLGPIDLAAIPIGGYRAYGKRHPNHVSPEEALRLFEDVGGALLVPIHWGTFDMNQEPFQEPPGRLMDEAVRLGLEERVMLLSPGQSIHR